MAEHKGNPRKPVQNTKNEALHRLDEDAQAGTNRGIHIVPNTRGTHNTVPAQAAYEGSVTTRTPEGEKQGISSHAQSEESSRQRKVVKDRPDATASLDHSKSA